ncbi:MAG: replicative DNA helicase [Bradyrhizobium sp.]|nr:replicative DNA helicase [Bradyrhizobium sp.]
MNSFDAESAVIGGCLLGSDGYWRIADLLTPEDFSRPEYGEMFGAVGDLLRKGIDVDSVTFGEHCPKYAQLAMECAAATPGATNIRAYAEIVQRNAVTRRVRSSGERIAKLSGADVLGEAQRILAACAPRMASAIRPAKDYLSQSVERMAQRCELDGDLTGVPTSIAWLDVMLSGWQRGDLIIVAARPSVGKTALAVQAALHAALNGNPTLFLSLEMAGHQLTDRMLAHMARVDMQRIRQPKQIEEDQWTRIADAGSRIAAAPLLIDDTSGITVDAIGARARQANATQRLGLVVIDYLTQIMPPKAQSVTEAVQIQTRTLKALAKEIQVPIILLSQLNRDGAHKPSLTSLRDSGAIEQDADVVVLLHRPNDEQRHLVECIVAKQRNGPIGDGFLHFNGSTQTFSATEERPVTAIRRRGLEAA